MMDAVRVRTQRRRGVKLARVHPRQTVLVRLAFETDIRIAVRSEEGILFGREVTYSKKSLVRI